MEFKIYWLAIGIKIIAATQSRRRQGLNNRYPQSDIYHFALIRRTLGRVKFIKTRDNSRAE